MILQVGPDTLAASRFPEPDVDVEWIAPFLGRQPGVIERYVNNIRHRAEEIREGVEERGLA